MRGVFVGEVGGCLRGGERGVNGRWRLKEEGSLVEP